MLLLVRLPIDPGARFAIAAILRYIILVVGLVFAFGMIGIKWSQVQWLAAAITVGLGFGLQEIFANFVSGLILLFERPVRIGDTITVGDISGTVSRIQIRATTILAWDRKELIIPNRDFVTGKVINWTLSDSTLRVVIPVGIAYGSDTRLAERLLRKVAAEHPLVLRDPEPIVVFSAFGESSLDFELRVYVGRADQFIKVKHELHQAIDDTFREAGIEIAFPQRDIHVRSVQDTLPVDARGPKPSGKPS
jgi:potassium efflux system protein